MSGIEKWNAEKVIEVISDEVAENIEGAAHIVKTDARRNLLKIKEPEWGAAYRRILALYRLKTVTRRTKRYVEAGIGMPAGKKGSDYGYWIETGSSTAPAHPWLRPALLHNLPRIVRLVGGGK